MKLKMHYYKVCDSYARFCPPVLHPNVRSEIIIVLEVMLGNTIGYFGSFSGDFYSFLS